MSPPAAWNSDDIELGGKGLPEALSSLLAFTQLAAI